MSSLNRVVILGNLGKDPELVYSQSGMAIAKFSLATNERRKGRDGEWNEEVEWHSVVLFDKKAEVAGEYLKKGSTALIEGSLRTSSWDDKETGQKRYKTEVIGSNLVLVGGRRQAEESPAPSRGEQDGTMITDEDIPF